MKFPKTYTMESERCRYRLPNEADFPFIESACKYQGFNDGMLWEPPKCEADFTEPLKRSIESWEQDKAYVFTIEDKVSGQFLGRIGIRHVENTIWDFGYFTHPESQGKGYMTEAVGRMLKWTFEELEGTRVEACYATWNVASKIVMERNGFKFIEHLEKGFQKHGKWVAEDKMAITKEQWLSENPDNGN